jgi:hypothetical protein
MAPGDGLTGCPKGQSLTPAQARRTFATPALKPFVREGSLLGSHVQRDLVLLYDAWKNSGTRGGRNGGPFSGRVNVQASRYLMVVASSAGSSVQSP